MNSERMGWQTRSGRLEATEIPVQKPSVEGRLLMRCLLKDGSTVGFEIWVPTTAVGYSQSSVSQPGYKQFNQGPDFLTQISRPDAKIPISESTVHLQMELECLNHFILNGGILWVWDMGNRTVYTRALYIDNSPQQSRLLTDDFLICLVLIAFQRALLYIVEFLFRVAL